MIKIKDDRTNWDKLVKNTEPLKKGPVVGIGYPENKVDNSIIAYATYNHFGTDRIPPRPFLTVTIDTQQDKIKALQDKITGAVLDDKLTVDKGLSLLGTAVTGMVKQTISGPYFKENVPNAPSTINHKGSDQPLIDTGAMRNATTYEVFLKGKPTT